MSDENEYKRSDDAQTIVNGIDESTEPDYTRELLELFRSDLPPDELREKLDAYHENDMAGALEQMTPEERKRLYPILGIERVSEIFTFIEDVDEYMKELDIASAAKVIGSMDSDDAVDVLEEMDEEAQEQLTEMLDEEASADIKMIRSYDDDEIGSKMTTN